MAKTKASNLENLQLDEEALNEQLPLTQIVSPQEQVVEIKSARPTATFIKEPINCLRNEKIIVRFIKKKTGLVDNPRHILFGGLAEGSSVTYVVPRLSSGMFVNVLTDNEKAYLEETMGLENNALSIYKKVDNFWDDSNEKGISKVRLTKEDNILDLADPEDFIRYKILLANKDYIAKDMKTLQDHPKSTYRFVIISEKDEHKDAEQNMTYTMQAYKEFGKIEEDAYTMATIIEILTGRPVAFNTKLEFLKTNINDLIQQDSKMFIKVVKDELLPIKVIMRRCMEQNLIGKRGNQYVLISDGSYLCEVNEEATYNIAARYLSSPKHQELLFSLQAKLS